MSEFANEHEGVHQLALGPATDPDEQVDDLSEFEGELDTPSSEAGRDLQKRDAELLEIARKKGTSSGEYRLLEDRLIRYAVSILEAWIRNGDIFIQAARRRRPLDPTPQELFQLNSDHRDVVNETAIEAMATLRQQIETNTGWTAKGGASIRTYFMGAVVFAFVKTFKAYRRELQGRPVPTYELDDHQRGSAESFDSLLGQQVVQAALATLPERSKRAVRARLDGLTYAEIAETQGWPSGDSVRTALYRLRTNQPLLDQLFTLTEELR